jgi:hypothetical protein
VSDPTTKLFFQPRLPTGRLLITAPYCPPLTPLDSRALSKAISSTAPLADKLYFLHLPLLSPTFPFLLVSPLSCPWSYCIVSTLLTSLGPGPEPASLVGPSLQHSLTPMFTFLHTTPQLAHFFFLTSFSCSRTDYGSYCPSD